MTKFDHISRDCAQDIIIVGHPDALASIYQVVGTGAQHQLRIQYFQSSYSGIYLFNACGNMMK